MGRYGRLPVGAVVTVVAAVGAGGRPEAELALEAVRAMVMGTS